MKLIKDLLIEMFQEKKDENDDAEEHSYKEKTYLDIIRVLHIKY